MYVIVPSALASLCLYYGYCVFITVWRDPAVRALPPDRYHEMHKRLMPGVVLVLVSALLLLFGPQLLYLFMVQLDPEFSRVVTPQPIGPMGLLGTLLLILGAVAGIILWEPPRK